MVGQGFQAAADDIGLAVVHLSKDGGEALHGLSGFVGGREQGTGRPAVDGVQLEVAELGELWDGVER